MSAARFCAPLFGLAEWHGLLLDRLDGAEAADRLDRPASHPALGGPELTFALHVPSPRC
jgi:hypothetical protein